MEIREGRHEKGTERGASLAELAALQDKFNQGLGNRLLLRPQQPT